MCINTDATPISLSLMLAASAEYRVALALGKERADRFFCDCILYMKRPLRCIRIPSRMMVAHCSIAAIWRPDCKIELETLATDAEEAGLTLFRHNIGSLHFALYTYAALQTLKHACRATVKLRFSGLPFLSFSFSILCVGRAERSSDGNSSSSIHIVQLEVRM